MADTNIVSASRTISIVVLTSFAARRNRSVGARPRPPRARAIEPAQPRGVGSSPPTRRGRGPPRQPRPAWTPTHTHPSGARLATSITGSPGALRHAGGTARAAPHQAREAVISSTNSTRTTRGDRRSSERGASGLGRPSDLVKMIVRGVRTADLRRWLVHWHRPRGIERAAQLHTRRSGHLEAVRTTHPLDVAIDRLQRAAPQRVHLEGRAVESAPCDTGRDIGFVHGSAWPRSRCVHSASG